MKHYISTIAILFAFFAACSTSAQQTIPSGTDLITDAVEDQAGQESAPKLFLVNRQRELWGIPALATDSNLVDLGVGFIDGDPYWDAYGTGALYEAPGDGLGNQIWYVNFASLERRQLTDGNCIPGIGTLDPDWRCSYQSPIVASPYGGMAFIQQVVAGSETPHWQVIMVADGVARMVLVLNARPRSMSWSANGDWLLVPTGTDMTAIGKSSGLVCDYPGVAAQQILYLDWGGRNGGEVVYANGGDLWLVPLRPHRRADRCPGMQTARNVKLTNTADADDRPQWMAPNDLIAFVSNRPLGGAAAGSNLWAINPDNPTPAPIAQLTFPIQHTDWQSSSGPANTAKIKGASKP